MPTTVRTLLDLIVHHPANQGRRGRALARALGWQLYKRTIRRPFNLRVYDGMRMRAYADSHQPGRMIYFGGMPDWEEMQFMLRYLRPGDGFIDAGANVGVYTLLAAKLVGSAGTVHAFEGGPQTVERLRENVALNGLRQVHVHGAALADREGTVRFTVGRAATSGDRIARDVDPVTASVEVPSVTLDALAGDDFAMAKLDLEGAEPLALRGAARLLAAQNPPVWELELVDKFLRRYDSSAAGVVATLRDAGYLVGRYLPDENRLELDDALVGRVTNVLAVAEDRVDDVCARLAGGVTV